MSRDSSRVQHRPDCAGELIYRYAKPPRCSASVVHLHRHAGDHRGLLAAQIDRRGGDVRRGREPADGDGGQEASAHLRRILAHEGGASQGLAGHGVDGVHADAKGRKLHRHGRVAAIIQPLEAFAPPGQVRPGAGDAAGGGDVENTRRAWRPSSPTHGAAGGMEHRLGVDPHQPVETRPRPWCPAARGSCPCCGVVDHDIDRAEGRQITAANRASTLLPSATSVRTAMRFGPSSAAKADALVSSRSAMATLAALGDEAVDDPRAEPGSAAGDDGAFIGQNACCFLLAEPVVN